MSELILGTAQFGAAYGVLNSSGALQDEDVTKIIQLALESGILKLDTSALYGKSERRIQMSVPGQSEVAVVTKFALPESDIRVTESLVSERLDSLRPLPIWGLLFHRVEDMRDRRADAAWQILREAQIEGVVKKVGASVYSEQDLDFALQKFPEMDLLQIPGNAVDRRLLNHPLLREFRNQGGTVHVRSAYLQGMLLLEPSDLPLEFKSFAPTLTRLRHAARSESRSVSSLLLGFLKHHPVVDGVVVGALSARELRETTLAWREALPTALALPQLPERLVDPRRWRRNSK